MCDYLDEVLLNLRPTLKKTKHEVRVDCPPNLEVTSYPGSLSQVLTNLVTNSLIHGFEDQPAGHIDIKVETRGERLLFEYRDDGKGIPPDHLDKVFEPFFTTRRGQGGSGLGLHVVYNIVKQHLRGDIRCSSEPGKGTTFTIDIPYEA
jgi:signal transduction histidine kinase